MPRFSSRAQASVEYMLLLYSATCFLFAPLHALILLPLHMRV